LAFGFLRFVQGAFATLGAFGVFQISSLILVIDTEAKAHAIGSSNCNDYQTDK
jgi:hypothetical protein